MDPQRQKLLEDINLAINNSEENSSLVQSLNDLSLKVRDATNDINSLTMEFNDLTPSEGGRRHRGSKKAHKGKRHGNASLRAWVTFVKKVQKEEGVGYKEAMTLAKKRKDKGEKWRGGGDEGSTPGSSDEDEEYNGDQDGGDGESMPPVPDEDSEMKGGRRRRRRTRRHRGSKKHRKSHRRTRSQRRSRRHH
jgi:hypothetical protein